jgi:hypothetical protein
MNDLYIPRGAQTLDKITKRSQVRLGLQGYGGVGKTWFALTFPNPIVLNLDKGLGAHKGRSDVIEVPFYDPIFSKKDSLKDDLIKWINDEAIKLRAEQTLVVDGCTSIQNAYHRWWKANQHRFMTRQGQVDEFSQWREKVTFFSEIFETFKFLNCDVIFIVHETAQKDKDGGYSGKIRPLLTGQMGDEIVNHFTDFYRMHSMSKPKEPTLTSWGVKDMEEFNALWSDGLCIRDNTIYYIQTTSDNIFDAKASSLVNFPSLIPANYQHLKKYMRP